MLKITITMSVLVLGIVLFQCNPTFASSDSDESSDELSPAEYQAAINAVRRGLLAELLLKEVEYEPEYEKESVIEKRFPKWRTGNTRTRVNLLNHNRQPFKYGNWASNMREKNKMYEKMHG